MNHLIERATEHTYVVSAAVTGVGIFTWLDEHSRAVGAICAIIGVFIALCTAGINFYYKHKNSKRG